MRASEFMKSWLTEVLESGSDTPSVIHPQSKASNFGQGGRDYKELLGSARILSSAKYGYAALAQQYIHLPYLFAQAIWSLDGRDDVDTLAYYRPAARDFSDDGTTLCGAFGRRIFWPSGASQADRIVDLAAVDISSRRLYASILSPQDDAVRTREYPCAIGLQFFARGGKLETVVNMRAQQLLTVLPYDLFLFSVFAMWFAHRMQLQVGSIHYLANTAHIYASELGAARSLIRASTMLVDPELPGFEGRDDNRYISDLSTLEMNLRTCSTVAELVQLATPDRSDDPFMAVSRYVLARHAASVLQTGYEVIPGAKVSAEWQKVVSSQVN